MDKIKFRSFTNARKFARSLGLKNTTDWKKYSKSERKPADIPANPSQAYEGKGWKGMPDWLDNGNISNKDRKYVTFTDCKKFAKKNKITTQNEWAKFSKSGKRPKTIPSKPDREYKKQGVWKGWPNFCGVNRIANQNKIFLSFDKARSIVHSLKITSQKEYQSISKEKKLPIGITSAPWKIYESEFVGWSDWLGTERVANQTKSKNWLSWPEAKLLYRKIGQENNLKNYTDWVKYKKIHKLPKGLPAYPADVYTKENVWNKMQKDL